MAELPELVVYAEVLARHLVGRRIAAVDVAQPRVLRRTTAADLQAGLPGRAIAGVVRRGKTLALSLVGGVGGAASAPPDANAGPRLDVHLMLGGEPYLFGPGEATTVPQPTLALRLDDGGALVFSDRHFDLLRPGEAKMWVGLDQKERAGVDPTGAGFTPEAFAALCRKQRLWPIKAVLCDQRLVAGLGNAYADEILWEARVRPRRAASLMTPDEIARVHAATGQVIAAATDALRAIVGDRLRGEPKRDFLRVHHRARRACPRCGTKIAAETLRDRITNWCPMCQG